MFPALRKTSIAPETPVNFDKTILILGREKTGKTSVFNRIMTRRFSTQATTAVAYKKMGGQICRIIDTTNEEAKYADIQQQMTNADAIIYVFDSRKHNESIERDLEILRDAKQRSPGASFQLVFSKIELDKDNEAVTAFKNQIDNEVSKALGQTIVSIDCSARFIKGYDVLEKNLETQFSVPANPSSLKTSLFGTKNALSLDENNNEDPLVRDIKLYVAKLNAEHNSWWPYPNKAKKFMKMIFWNEVLQQHASGIELHAALENVSALARHPSTVIKAGYISQRSVELMEKIQQQGAALRPTIVNS